MVSSPPSSPPMRQVAQPPSAHLPPAELLQRLQTSLSHLPSSSTAGPSASSPAPDNAARDGIPSYYHYPSRLGTVPTDNFAPSQSSYPGSPTNAQGRESWEERSRESSDGPGFGDRRAFSPGNTYDYNRTGLSPIPASPPLPGAMSRSRSSDLGLGAGAGAASGWGWEKEGGRRKRNKRFLICLAGLAVVGLAVGLGVGLSTRSTPSDKVAEPVAAPSSPTSSSSSPSSSSSSLSSSPTSPISSETSSTDPAITPNAVENIATQTTVFTYLPPSTTAITSVALLYTIPTSGVATRDGARPDTGYLQFTNNVELPDGMGGVFTSALRMRVYTSGLKKTATSTSAKAKTTSIDASTATAGVVRERRGLDKPHGLRRH